MKKCRFIINEMRCLQITIDNDREYYVLIRVSFDWSYHFFVNNRFEILIENEKWFVIVIDTFFTLSYVYDIRVILRRFFYDNEFNKIVIHFVLNLNEIDSIVFVIEIATRIQKYYYREFAIKIYVIFIIFNISYKFRLNALKTLNLVYKKKKNFDILINIEIFFWFKICE